MMNNDNDSSIAKLVIAATLVASLPGCAGTFTSLQPRDWIAQQALVVEATVDCTQTYWIVAQGTEANPLIGSHGENMNFVAGGLLMLGTELLITWALPRKVRPFFEGAAIGIEGGVVTNNFINGCTPWGCR